ncbi:MAG: TolC family protein [Planctomycetota bacterium]|jgi:outer membrane protein TolC|nr:TolC family protein [Planctomycetota bacterium]
MTRRNRAALLSAQAVLAFALAGCLPSDAAIEGELSASRREAYLEWKNQRQSGRGGETRADGPLALDDSVKLALQYNKQLRAALQDREITRGGRISSYAVILPSFGVSGGNGHTESGAGGYFDNYSAGLSVQQPLLDAAIAPRLMSARLNTALTDELIRGQVQDLIASVANTYYDILLAQRMVETHREALTSAEAQYHVVSVKMINESATEYDGLRAQVDIASSRANMQKEMNNIDTARVSLLKLMGISQDSEISFSDKLEFLPMRPVLERAVEIASGQRSDLRQSELNYRLEQEAVRVARSEFLPTLAMTYSQNWSEGGQSGNAFGRNPWSLGFGASLNLGIEDYGGLVAAKARAKRAQIQILDTRETVIKEIRQYMNSLANAEETVKALEVNQDAAREALRLALVGYQEAGTKTEVDVSAARKALTDVIGSYYEALANHSKARLNLQVALGVLGPARIDGNMPSPPNVPIANIAEFAADDYVPPEPIPMPTPHSSSRRVNPNSQPAAASPPRRQPPAAAPSRPAAIQPAAAPVAPAPPAALRSQAPLPQAPANGLGRSRPLELADSPVLAEPAGLPPTQPTPVRPPMPVKPAERPLFRILVRNADPASPEMANADK